VAFAYEVSVASVGAARRLSPTQRDEVRKGWRPLILPRLASDLPTLPTPKERFASLVSELGVAGALDELAAIERNGGNGNGK
jgi:hypothetical protein